MLKLYILFTFVISPYTTLYPSAMGRGYGCVQQFPEHAMTKHQLPSPFPLSPLAQTESMHTTKSASYRQNTNLEIEEGRRSVLDRRLSGSPP
jgi:hypothetical protein